MKPELSCEDIDKLLHAGYPKKIVLSTGDYYCKATSEIGAINELIGRFYAQVFRLDCPQCFVYKIQDNFFVLSEDLNNEGEFKTAEELGLFPLDASNHYLMKQIKELFKRKFRNYEWLVLLILKVYIYDLLLVNDDRNLANWGVIFGDNTRIAIIDNERLFSNNKETCMHMGTNYLADRYEDFDDFIKHASYEELEMIRLCFKLINLHSLKVNLEILELEQEIEVKHKEEILAIFQENFEQLVRIGQKRIKER